MASFAPGTSQQYMDDYYRRVGPSLGGTGPEMPPMARPDSRNSVTVSGGQVFGKPLGQPTNRPFQGTLPPVVPQSPAMSAYKPSRSQPQRWTGSEWVTLRSKRDGQAQPVQPQSQGTPYHPGATYAQPGGPAAFDLPVLRDARNPGPDRPVLYGPLPTPEYMAANPDVLLKSGSAGSSALPPAGPSEITRQQIAPIPSQPGWQPPSVIPGGGLGNLAYSPPDRRPQPFSTSIRGPDGNQYDPSQFFPMRDAFIQNINDARSAFAANPSAGRPQMDMGRMWGRAGDMVQQGWQSPLRGLFG